MTYLRQPPRNKQVRDRGPVEVTELIAQYEARLARNNSVDDRVLYQGFVADLRNLRNIHSLIKLYEHRRNDTKCDNEFQHCEMFLADLYYLRNILG